MNEPHQVRRVAESFGSDAERYDLCAAQAWADWANASSPVGRLVHARRSRAAAAG